MLLRMTRLAALALACAAACAADTSGQSPQQAGAGALVVEFDVGDGIRAAHVKVPGSMWTSRVRRLKPGAVGSDETPSVVAVGARTRLEGAGVRVVVFVHLGKKYHDAEREVGSHLIREGETVTAPELSQLGVAPVTLRVIKAVARPREALPVVTNRTGSLVVLGVEDVGTLFPDYRVRLRNSSGRGVVEMPVRSLARGAIHQLERKARNEVLIPPGGEYELRVSATEGGDVTPEGYAPRGVTEIVIAAALFADGSYEGESDQVALRKAAWLGRRIQLARIVALLAEESGGDGAAALGRLGARVRALPEKAEGADMNTLLAEFPADNAMRLAGLKSSVEFELHTVKKEFSDSLASAAEQSTAAGAPPFDAREWLLGVRARYEGWLSRN
jgi:hypothetical protein